MSGKKDKESRRLTKSVDDKMAKHLKTLEAAKRIDHAKMIAIYNKHLRAMTIRKKLGFAYSLFFYGIINRCKNYILFWK